MKLIVTHKKHLIRSSDVTRFIAYIYGPKRDRPVLPVEGHVPGLPTGDPVLDTTSLLAQHHCGKAAKARSIVLSSEYLPDREAALANAPAMAKSASAFRMAWAPQSSAVSVVHLTKGEEQYAGMWRLDAHLVLANSDGQKGLQWTRTQCSEMQDLNWIPVSVRDQFVITPGKGTGVRRTEKLPYPKAQNLIAYEIGILSDHQIASGISCGVYGAPRRAKGGRVISIEAEGRRINISRARHLVAVRDGAEGGRRSVHPGGAAKREPTRGSARAGLTPKAAVPLPKKGIDFDLGGRGEGRGSESACSHFLRQRLRRVSSHRSVQPEGTLGTFGIGDPVGRSASAPLATHRQARAVVSHGKAVVGLLSKVLGEMESIQILR
jgi:hypothetical protein